MSDIISNTEKEIYFWGVNWTGGNQKRVNWKPRKSETRKAENGKKILGNRERKDGQCPEFKRTLFGNQDFLKLNFRNQDTCPEFVCFYLMNILKMSGFNRTLVTGYDKISVAKPPHYFTAPAPLI